MVNNNAAAMVLAATALTSPDVDEIVVSRGELIEIGDRFRLPDLLESTGARLREVGTTNRTTAADYADAIGPRTAFILKVHPSNYRIEGFTAAAAVSELAALGDLPVVFDIGSGLLAPHPVLPEEPSAATALRDGAALVTASGDKLLGGPQAGLLLGRADLVRRLTRHPLARALRVDKLTLAALEATLAGPVPPVRGRAGRRPGIGARSSRTGRSAPGRRRPGRPGGGGQGRRGRWRCARRGTASAAVSLPESLAVPLRWSEAVARGEAPAVVGRIEAGRLLLDLRSVAPEDDDRLVHAILTAHKDDFHDREQFWPNIGHFCSRSWSRGAVMHVIATAGHVDHGKSALVRALTGMEPDRWAEERRRGLTIDLGFAWMTLPGGDRVAFVDVPGHERFVPNMLAGVGPAPAVLFVVAADGGWMPQSAEHLAAIDAVGIRHGLLAVTRCDLADPGPATRQALDVVSRTSLGTVEAVAVSAVTGAGLPELRDALARLVAALPAPDPAAPVRLWVDRSFSIRGSGTVVTGTLPAGTITVGQELLLTPSLRPARIRGLESLNEPVASVTGVARVAVNLRGIPADFPARGMALVEAGRWTLTKLVDVRLSLPPEMTVPRQCLR